MDREFSEEEISQFLKEIGASSHLSRKASKNLFRILGVPPVTDDDGTRVPTPYEILAVPPQFRDGVEVPIVFAIKNRTVKIGHYTGSENLFYYAKKNKNKTAPSIETTLSELKKKYKRAIFLGNVDEASSYLDMINTISGGRADEVMGSFYNYALFYKKMKKQLLMDMFSHFFLTYLFKYKTFMKEGLFNSTTHFKPYIEKKSFTLNKEEIRQISSEVGIGGSPKDDFGEIKNFKFETPEIDFDDMPVFASQPKPVSVPQTPPQMPPQTASQDASAEDETKKEAKVENQKQDEPKSFIKLRKNVRPSFLERLGLSDNEEESEKSSEPTVTEDKLSKTELFEDIKSLN